MNDELNDSVGPEEDAAASEGENKNAISSDLIRGHINTIILRTLYERDKYGYEIIDEIEAKSHGQYTLKQPTLYSALKRLESQGYINAYWKTDELSQGGRRKYYTLTDSGREVTERNQAEWEYSRTVIDNLISDRNFDFTQPPPAAVDFSLLKQSTSRVPVVKDESETPKREVVIDEPNKESVVEVKHDDTITQTVSEADKKAEEVAELKPAESADFKRVEENKYSEILREPAREETPEMTEEQRRQLHENYLNLISDNSKNQAPVEEAPFAEHIDTESLIYNNRPDTERDYRNLINNLFGKAQNIDTRTTPAREAAQYERSEKHSEAPAAVRIIEDDFYSKAEDDGLTVATSEYEVAPPKKKRYNRGSTLFKCSLIVGVIMLLEFALCLIFRNDLGVSLAYPFVIFALALAQAMIFGVLFYTDMGKSSKKPSSLIYISACIIVAIIAIVIIFIVSLLLNVNFASAGDVMAKIVVPCIIALNIPIFAGCFYFMSK